MRNPLILSGSVLITLMAAMALLAPWLAPYDPTLIQLDRTLLPPGNTHLMGTDALGRDVFSRVLYGARISLMVGFIAVGISTLIGIFLGALAGLFRGWTDSIIMRFVDIMLCFPSFFLILAVVALLEPSLVNIMIIIGVTSWMGVTRLVRAEFLKLMTMDFIAAAQTQGVSMWRIGWRYLLSNSMAPVFVSMTLGIAGAILVESGLSFLGIGIQPPTPSWGNILTEGKANIRIAWWLSFFPGMAIFLTVMGYSLLGEGLRDALDPRLKKN